MQTDNLSWINLDIVQSNGSTTVDNHCLAREARTLTSQADAILSAFPTDEPTDEPIEDPENDWSVSREHWHYDPDAKEWTIVERNGPDRVIAPTYDGLPNPADDAAERALVETLASIGRDAFDGRRGADIPASDARKPKGSPTPNEIERKTVLRASRPDSKCVNALGEPARLGDYLLRKPEHDPGDGEYVLHPRRKSTRKYATNAERQKAHRARVKASKELELAAAPTPYELAHGARVAAK